MDWDALQSAHDRLRGINQQLHQLQSQRRQASRIPNNELSVERAQIASLKREQDAVEQELYDLAIGLPNSTWEGSDPVENRVIEEYLVPNVNHESPDTSLVDFKAGVRSTGSQFYFLRGKLALLHQALCQYAMKGAMELGGYEPIIPPDLVQTKWIRACGFNPRAQDTGLPIYRVQADEDKSDTFDLALTGTAEVPLAANYAGETITNAPIKWVAIGHAFRPEVGHSGAESRGLYRVHQFTKIELFQILPPTNSMEAFEQLCRLQMELLKPLGIPLRRLEMACWELGSSAHRKQDIEGWLSHSQRWGELTSASHCLDYQTRRLAIRMSGGHHYPHTLNGTAMAIPRVIMALLEQHTRQGVLHLPECLHPFMLDGSTTISLN